MRNWIIAASCAVLAQLPASPAIASVTSTSAQATVAGHHYLLTRQELDQFVGSYELANGKLLRVLRKNKRFYYELDGQAPVEIDAVSPSSFADGSGQRRLDFTQAPSGAAYQVKLTLDEATAEAAALR